jgi:predicted dehydrogenase
VTGSPPLRGALVGFGKIAESTHLPALAQAGLELVAIVEAVPARRDAARAALPNARIYESMSELLGAERLDFVDICTPPHLHFEAACAAAAAGLHVLCEKPLVLRREHGETLRALARARDVVVTCMHNWTQAPILVRARELAHALGPVRAMELVTLRTEPAGVAGDSANWRIDPAKAGGGILYDHGWHGMSILLRTLGARPTAVRAEAGRRKYHDLAVEDTVTVDVDFDGGARGRFEATWAASERRNRGAIECAAGRIELDGDHLRSPRGEERFAESLAGGGYRPAWTAGIAREFRAEIEGRSARGRGLEEALTCLLLLETAYDSAKRNSLIPL